MASSSHEGGDVVLVTKGEQASTVDQVERLAAYGL